MLTQAHNESLAAVVVFYRQQFWAFVGKSAQNTTKMNIWANARYGLLCIMYPLQGQKLWPQCLLWEYRVLVISLLLKLL